MSSRTWHKSARRARRPLIAALLALVAVGVAAFVALAAPTMPAPTVSASVTSSPTSSRTQTFTFSAAGAASYQCALDTTTFSACTSPKSYSGLADGQHTFQVRALDSKGKTGDTATYRWTVDATAPTLVGITRAAASPTNASSVSWTATFSESVTGVVAARFGLTPSGLGGSPAITGIGGSGTTYTVTASTGSGDGSLRLDLTNGAASIKDGAGNALSGTLPIAVQAYTLDRSAPPAPSITSKPSDPQSAADGQSTFVFGDTESGVAFRCSIDGTAEAGCTSPKSYTLGQGHHTFAVVAVDAVGNRSEVAAYVWDIVQPVKNFTVTGDAPTALYPGNTVPLNLTLSNPNNYSLTVTSLKVTVATVNASGACTTADFATAAFSGSLVIPSGTTTLQAAGLARSQWPTVTMNDTGLNQNGCQGAALTLQYEGIAVK